ncbi:MAG: hypothetical protein IKZ61_04415 [Prevotella sp.]|nr:hypothetical protein [Prevotella sp.]
MKRIIFATALMCTMAMNCNAQYWQGLEYPTRDLYDTNLMMEHIRAVRETAAQRLELYNYYSNLAVEAYYNHRWVDVITYVNNAFSTDYVSGDLYFIRGFAFEQLGYTSDAKKDYKRGSKNGSMNAAMALESLKAKKKKK